MKHIPFPNLRWGSNKIRILFICVLSWALLSCQTLKSFTDLSYLNESADTTLEREEDKALPKQKDLSSVPFKAPLVALSKKPAPVKKEVHTTITSSESPPSLSPYGTIKIDDNEKVDKWINYFQTAGREKMELYLSRSTRYLHLMKKILREEGLPEDLVYVAMIESGFSPYARSFANAVGYWQFIEGTGKRYGLKINSYVDERRDPLLATRAAARYFKDLYNVFTSWNLALASYNAGEYRVTRAVLRYYTKDFWFLSAKRSLPRETINYVPKFMAALRISKNPEQYGFGHVQYQEPFQYDTVSLHSPISLKKLAHNLQVSNKELSRLNPRYRGEYVPIDEEQTLIRVPVGKHIGIDLASAYMKKPPFVYSDHYWYRVRRGDTLYRLAHRNKTTVSTIKRMNKMGHRSSLLRAGRKIKLPYYNRQKKQLNLMASVHVVKIGDSLHSIADKYKVKVHQLKKLNRLSASAVIHPGQVLHLLEKSKRAPQSLSTKGKIHTVRKGETLIGIAKKYKVSLPLLMKKNALNFKSILVAGRQLTIP